MAEIVGSLAVAVLVIYTLFGGADFGGGILDLVARGPRAGEQRKAIAAAIGPIWEANHVWLIFLIVILFTAFPAAYAAMSVALFWPLHLLLVGIALRGGAFVFRAHGRVAGAPSSWGAVFGIASAVSPFLLGASLGAVSGGGIRIVNGAVIPDSIHAWLAPFPLAVGLLTLFVCAYLASVYLTVETDGEVREDFRRRALFIWLAGGVASLGVLLLTRTEAPRLWEALTSPRAGFVVVAGMLLAPASALALLRRRYILARFFAAGQVVMLLAGWALAHWPFLIYPDLPLQTAAAPPATLAFVLWTLPFGLAILAPSLWLLFAVFKGRNPAIEQSGNDPVHSS